MTALRELLWVALGGALGSVSRYALSLAAAWLSVSGLWATLAANGLGSLLIGVSFVLLKGDAYLMAAVGFCGGFTTFSTFSLQALDLFQQGEKGLSLLYMAGSLLLSVACVALGLWVANRCIE